jgi:hypothetical protein
MKTTAGLLVIAVGAILAFAVTTNTSDLNLHTTGFVLMIIGVLGLVLPRGSYGWLTTRVIRRRRYRPTSVEYSSPYVNSEPTTPTRPVRAVIGSREPDSSTEVVEEDVYEEE